jgi:hypothetical protein
VVDVPGCSDSGARTVHRGSRCLAESWIRVRDRLALGISPQPSAISPYLIHQRDDGTSRRSPSSEHRPTQRPSGCSSVAAFPLRGGGDSGHRSPAHRESEVLREVDEGPGRLRSTLSAARVSEAAAYLAKAGEFLRPAKDSLELGNNAAAVGNAVHAGIPASDAITTARSRTVWRGEHSQAPAHLEASGEEGQQAARHLRRLLPLKTRAEYDPAPVPAVDAKAAVNAADRRVTIAALAVT